MSSCRVAFDGSRCSAIGLCEAAMPDVFQLGADGVLHLLVDDVDASRRRELEDVALSCPTQSISVEFID